MVGTKEREGRSFRVKARKILEEANDKETMEHNARRPRWPQLTYRAA